jgi:hypothetical protein
MKFRVSTADGAPITEATVRTARYSISFALDEHVEVMQTDGAGTATFEPTLALNARHALARSGRRRHALSSSHCKSLTPRPTHVDHHPQSQHQGIGRDVRNSSGSAQHIEMHDVLQVGHEA